MDSEKFILREWRLSDAKSLAFHANNLLIWNNVRDYFPHPYTENDGKTFISTVTDRQGPTVDFAIDISGQAAGGVGIVLQQDVERVSAEIGYWLGEAYWNRGIMTDTVRQTVNYAFHNFPLVKLFAPVFEYNMASMKVLEKAGFTKEAVLKKAAVKNGRIIDLHYYSLIKTGDEPLIYP